jgi:hypothetical protein
MNIGTMPESEEVEEHRNQSRRIQNALGGIQCGRCPARSSVSTAGLNKDRRTKLRRRRAQTHAPQSRRWAQMKQLSSALAVLVIALVAVHDARAAEPVWVELNLVEDWAKREQKSQERLRQDKGAQQAKADIAQGKLKIQKFGLLVMDDWSRKRDRLLSKYGIEEENLGCDSSPNYYVQAYNAEMNREIERRYGRKFWVHFDVELQSFEAEPNKLLQPIAPKRAPAEQ